MTQFIGGLLYIGLLLIPGWLFTRAFFPKQPQFLFSYALSLLILTAISIVSSVFGFVRTMFIPSVCAVTIALVVVNFYLANRKPSSAPKDSGLTDYLFRKKELGLGGLFISIAFSCYHITVGSYSEVPSDIWIHLARVTDVFLGSESASRNACWSLDCLSDQGYLAYILHASIAGSLGVYPIDLLNISTLVTGSIFLLSVYFFSADVFSYGRVRNRLSILGAVIATLLTLITFGTASFSFVRYYSFFPVALAFPVFLLVILLFIDFLERRPRSTLGPWLCIPFFILLMLGIHRQEAFFSLLLIVVLALIYGVETFIQEKSSLNSSFLRRRWALFIVLALSSVLAAGLLLGREMTEWRGSPHIVDAGLYLDSLKGLPLDNPTFRLWDTIGYTGLIVVVWAIFRWRILVQSKFLLAGLFIPVLTNLNPLFASLFLRIDMPTTLWRTAYLFPIGIVAAFLIVNTLFRSISTRGKILDSVLLIFFVLTCIPWQIGDLYNRTSRIPSLYPTSATSGAELWRDMIDASMEIQSRLPIKRIITDSTTGFILYASTQGKVYRWSQGNYFPKNNQEYQRDFLESDYSGSLLVVNRRDGEMTYSARHSGHWPADILQVSQKYPPGLSEFIDDHPHLFDRLWSSHDIDIFLMK